MCSNKLSKGEMRLITDGVKNNFREDGRQRVDYRCFDVESDIVPHSFGSARVCLGDTDVVCSVKVDLGVPSSNKPNEGLLKFFVHFASKMNFKEREKLQNQIATHLELAYDSNTVFDHEMLCIVSGIKCWILNLDICVLSNNGNLVDAAGLAVKAALHKTYLPLIKNINDNGNDNFQIEIDYNIKSGIRFHADKLPIFVTIRKIGSHYVVDPSLNEDKTGCFGLIIATSMNKIVGIYKTGGGSANLLHMNDNLSMALKIGNKLNEQFMKVLRDQDQQIPTTTNYSFF